MQFKLLALLSLVSVVSAQCSYRYDKSTNWNNAKIYCYNLHTSTSDGYRNKGCELYANCFGDSSPSNTGKIDYCLGNQASIDTNQATTRAHLFVSNKCRNYYNGLGYTDAQLFGKCAYVSQIYSMLIV
jgi:hypothetical protein